MKSEIKIALVDDHSLILDALSVFISENSKYKIVLTALHGLELLEKIRNGIRPHIIIMDIMMPEMDGIECTKIVKNMYPDIKVIILTMFDEKNFIERLKIFGASSYILKNVSKDQLFKAIDQVSLGKEYFPNLDIEEGW